MFQVSFCEAFPRFRDAHSAQPGLAVHTTVGFQPMIVLLQLSKYGVMGNSEAMVNYIQMAGPAWVASMFLKVQYRVVHTVYPFSVHLSK